MDQNKLRSYFYLPDTCMSEAHQYSQELCMRLGVYCSRAVDIVHELAANRVTPGAEVFLQTGFGQLPPLEAIPDGVPKRQHHIWLEPSSLERLERSAKTRKISVNKRLASCLQLSNELIRMGANPLKVVHNGGVLKINPRPNEPSRVSYSLRRA